MIIIFILLLPLVWLCNLNQQALRRISKDLQIFRGGITRDMLDRAKEVDRTCFVIIKQHKVFSNCNFKEYITFFESISGSLPNLEFVLNIDDNPKIFKRKCKNGQDWRQCVCDKDYVIPSHGFFKNDYTVPVERYTSIPVFSASTISECFSDILIPSYLHLNKSQCARIDYSWKLKKFSVIWRGASTGGNFNTGKILDLNQYHRQRLVVFCKQKLICDAKFSHYVQSSPQNQDKMNKQFGYPQYIPLKRQYRSKIIIDIDGNTYSGRFPKLLLQSGSVIFKIAAFQDLALVQTEPWKHYIPIKMDLSDLQERIEWAKTHDKQLEQIAKAGAQRALQVFRYDNFSCYMITLLTNYAKLLIPYNLNSENVDGTNNDP